MINKNKLKEHNIAELTFVNVTPYWKGGYDGKTITCIEWDENQDECRKIKVSEVTADTIVGLMRTVLRLILSCKSNNKTYKDVENEQIFKELFGYKTKLNNRIVIESSKFIIKVKTEIQNIENIKNKINNNIKNINYDINILKNPIGKKINVLNNELKFFELAVVGKGRKKLVLNRFKTDYINNYMKIQRIKLNYMDIAPKYLTKYLTDIPISKPYISDFMNYIKNNVINKKDKFIDMLFDLPIEPGKVKVTIKINKRPGIELSKSHIEVLLMLIIIGMTFIGVGRGVTRGFGKFKLENSSKNINNYENVVKLINSISNINYKNISESINNIINIDINNINLKYYRNIPCLLRSFYNYTEYKVDLKRNYDVLDILEKINESTLKANIKIMKKIKIRSKGHNIHTWILGLPRTQKPPCKRQRHKYVEKDGYVLVDKKEYRNSIYNKVEVGKLVNKGSDGRHISGLVFTPIVINGVIRQVFIIDLISFDIPCAIEDKELIHVGIPSLNKGFNCYDFTHRSVIDIILDSGECDLYLNENCLTIINNCNYFINDIINNIKCYLKGCRGDDNVV